MSEQQHESPAEAMARLRREATPDPWKVCHDEDGVPLVCNGPEGEHAGPVAWTALTEADAAFIAYAGNHADAIAEAERQQRAENDRLTQQLAGMTGERDSEREIAVGWERKCEDLEEENARLRQERDGRYATTLTQATAEATALRALLREAHSALDEIEDTLSLGISETARSAFIQRAINRAKSDCRLAAALRGV